MARRRALIALLLAAVLLGHGLALEWLARQVRGPSLLQPMATPMFTRLLAPAAPPPPPPVAVPKPPPAHMARAPRAMKSIAPSAPAEPSVPPEVTATVAPPEPAVETVGAEPVPSVVPSETAQDTLTAAVSPAPSTPGSADSTTQTATATATATTTTETGTVSLDTWPADTRLSYRVGGNYRGEITGDAHVQWQRDGARYQARVEVNIGFLANFTMTSQGVVGADHLSPRRYQEVSNGRVRDVGLGDAASVDLPGGRSVPRPPDVQDTASQFVELSHQFATGQALLEVGRSISFWMARPGGVDLWTYDVVKREAVATPRLGPVEAFHLKPQPIANARGKITAEMWFAPSLQYLPVRIRLNVDEATYLDLVVDRIEQR